MNFWCRWLRLVEARRLRDENIHLEARAQTAFQFPHIVGKSDKMLALFDLVAQVGPSRSTILISGESGTGKNSSPRPFTRLAARDKAFVPVSTGSIPVDLLESQLFGHVKGAFTSAVASKKGSSRSPIRAPSFSTKSHGQPRNPGQAAARDSRT